MNQAIKAWLASRIGRWVTLHGSGGLFTGVLLAVNDDGVVVQRLDDRQVCLSGALIALACDPENEAQILEVAEKIRAERIASRH